MRQGTHVTFRDLYGRKREATVERMITDHNGRELIEVTVEGANHNPWRMTEDQIESSASPVIHGHDESHSWHSGAASLHETPDGRLVVLCPLGHVVSGVGDAELSKNAHGRDSWTVKCYGKTAA